MPQSARGAKWTFGWVVVGPGREIVMPLEAEALRHPELEVLA